MASAAEQMIRGATVEAIGRLLPDARIIHELACPPRRADLAAVTTDRVILFELKSERDTLDRLDDQMAVFAGYAHVAVAVIHEKFFDTKPYNNGGPRFVGPVLPGLHSITWAFPDRRRGTCTDKLYEWKIPDTGLWQPPARALLGLLFCDEQRAVLRRHGLPVGGNGWLRTDRLAYHLTGQEIAIEVCRELRARRVQREISTTQARGILGEA